MTMNSQLLEPGKQCNLLTRIGSLQLNLCSESGLYVLSAHPEDMSSISHTLIVSPQIGGLIHVTYINTLKTYIHMHASK